MNHYFVFRNAYRAGNSSGGGCFWNILLILFLIIFTPIWIGDIIGAILFFIAFCIYLSLFYMVYKKVKSRIIRISLYIMLLSPIFWTFYINTDTYHEKHDLELVERYLEDNSSEVEQKISNSLHFRLDSIEIVKKTHTKPRKCTYVKTEYKFSYHGLLKDKRTGDLYKFNSDFEFYVSTEKRLPFQEMKGTLHTPFTDIQKIYH